MASSIRVSEKGSINAPLGILRPGRGKLGRGEEHPFTIDSEAVSYDHAEFRYAGGLWFFRDLGSTNGSWFEGQKLKRDVWVPVTTGTSLKVANVRLDIELLRDDDTSGKDTLVVIGPGVDLKEFIIPESGKALVVGGAQGDFHLNVGGSDPVSLIVERNGAGVEASNPTGALPLYKNGQEVTLKEYLSHLDQIEVGPYRVFVCFPRDEFQADFSTRSAPSDSALAQAFAPVSSATGFDKAKRGLPFGQTDPEGRFEDSDLEDLGIEPVFTGRYEAPKRPFAPNTLDGKLLILTLVFFFLSMSSLLGWLATRGG